MRYAIMMVAAVTALTGCTQLSAADRALLTGAQRTAEQAQDKADRAMQEAIAAREEANKAAQAAAAAEKIAADSAFTRGLQK